MKKAVINLETLSCPSCLQKIENALKGLNGIKEDSIEVLFNSSRVKMNFDSEILSINEAEKVIEDLGYPIIKSKVKDL